VPGNFLNKLLIDSKSPQKNAVTNNDFPNNRGSYRVPSGYGHARILCMRNCSERRCSVWKAVEWRHQMFCITAASLVNHLKFQKKNFQIVNQSKFGFIFSREYQWINGAYSGGAPPTGSKHAFFIFFAASVNSTNQASITSGCTTHCLCRSAVFWLANRQPQVR
jgi:hypothetical protein